MTDIERIEANELVSLYRLQENKNASLAVEKYSGRVIGNLYQVKENKSEREVYLFFSLGNGEPVVADNYPDAMEAITVRYLSWPPGFRVLTPEGTLVREISGEEELINVMAEVDAALAEGMIIQRRPIN